MEPTANPKILQFIPQPAFLVKGGKITAINEAADELQIKVDTDVEELITTGIDEYRTFTSGKLYLELKPGRAWVSLCKDYHLFTLDTQYSSPELRAFALASQHLRGPLSGAVSGTESLIQDEDIKDENLKKRLGQINRNLYQLMRALCNMSDISQLGTTDCMNLEKQNAASVFQEIFEKAGNLAKSADRSIRFRCKEQAIVCIMDKDLLERAVLNLISNAIKFSPEGSTIQAVLNQNGNRLTFTIENEIKDGIRGIYGNAFHRFLREPGIESGEMGLGIGMSIVSRAVMAHNGTVLLNTTRNNRVKVIVSIPLSISREVVKSPLEMLGGYTGGFDKYLIELSDVLPGGFYKSN